MKIKYPKTTIGTTLILATTMQASLLTNQPSTAKQNLGGINIVELPDRPDSPETDDQRRRRISAAMNAIIPLLFEDSPIIADFCGQSGYPDDPPFTDFNCDHEGKYAAALNNLSGLRLKRGDTEKACAAMYAFKRCNFTESSQVSQCPRMIRSVKRHGEIASEFDKQCAGIKIKIISIGDGS